LTKACLDEPLCGRTVPAALKIKVPPGKGGNRRRITLRILAAPVNSLATPAIMPLICMNPVMQLRKRLLKTFRSLFGLLRTIQGLVYLPLCRLRHLVRRTYLEV
jgi:hypothetical protein